MDEWVSERWRDRPTKELRANQYIGVDLASVSDYTGYMGEDGNCVRVYSDGKVVE